MKSPNHPVPSGDRLMAQLIIRCLGLLGHDVRVASDLRAFLPEQDPIEMDRRRSRAQDEIERLTQLWQNGGAPDLWFSYHPYYKAPDLLGPMLSRAFGLVYVTAEASYSARRNQELWQTSQAAVLDAVAMAAVNICFTARDEQGLRAVVPGARFQRLPAFIDPAPFLLRPPAPKPNSLVTVAMMRSGDKLNSYRALAQGLGLLLHKEWTLDVIGDGPARHEVEFMFSQLPPDRIRWHGRKSTGEIAELLSSASIYVWPGHGEAYGLAYLEAQAAGLPVVAEHVAGVPEVVRDKYTGYLTAPGDTMAYAAAISQLLDSETIRMRMAAEARRFARAERSIEQAACHLDEILARCIGVVP